MILLATSFMLFLISKMLMDSPPGKINKLYGYRTKKSMLNQENWNLAQKKSSEVMYKTNVYLLMSSIPFVIVDAIFLFIYPNDTLLTISLFLQTGIIVVGFLFVFYLTEKSL